MQKGKIVKKLINPHNLTTNNTKTVETAPNVLVVPVTASGTNKVL